MKSGVISSFAVVISGFNKAGFEVQAPFAKPSRLFVDLSLVDFRGSHLL